MGHPKDLNLFAVKAGFKDADDMLQVQYIEKLMTLPELSRWALNEHNTVISKYLFRTWLKKLNKPVRPPGPNTKKCRFCNKKTTGKMVCTDPVCVEKERIRVLEWQRNYAKDRRDKYKLNKTDRHVKVKGWDYYCSICGKPLKPPRRFYHENCYRKLSKHHNLTDGYIEQGYTLARDLVQEVKP